MTNTDTSRRAFTKGMLAAAADAALAPDVTLADSPQTASTGDIVGHGDFRYRVHREWGDLDPARTPINNWHEMVQDAQGRLIMIGDETKNNVLIYDRSGRLLDTWGTEYPYGARPDALGCGR